MAYKIKKVSKDRERRDFSKNENSLELKDLLEIQKKSYDLFITEGIKEVLDDMFPVENFSGSLSLEISDYSIDTPRFTIKECKERKTSFVDCIR